MLGRSGKAFVVDSIQQKVWKGIRAQEVSSRTNDSSAASCCYLVNVLVLSRSASSQDLRLGLRVWCVYRRHSSQVLALFLLVAAFIGGQTALGEVQGAFACERFQNQEFNGPVSTQADSHSLVEA